MDSHGAEDRKTVDEVEHTVADGQMADDSSAFSIMSKCSTDARCSKPSSKLQLSMPSTEQQQRDNLITINDHSH